MKFKAGDSIDAAHCIALKHEFLCCEDAFKDFECSAYLMIMKAQNEEQSGATPVINQDRFIAYKTYNSYARFIHHLYEFMVGALAREIGDTGQIPYDLAERYISGHAQRILTGRREAILNGTAPVWENAITAYAEKIPDTFASDFRLFRNKTSGHVKYERSNMSMTEFYDKYHQYLYMIYWNCLDFWGSHRDSNFPDLKEITEFSVFIKSHDYKNLL